MESYFQKVKEYLLELNFTIVQEDEEDGVFVVEKEEEGMANVVLIVAEPILIVEQYLFELSLTRLALFLRMKKTERKQNEFGKKGSR